MAKRDIQPVVYILCSQRNGTLYIGVTSNLIGRTWQHQTNLLDGFTKRYNVHRLVYYEVHTSMQEAISREKKLKFYRRAQKIALIEKGNKQWRDLYPEILGSAPQESPGPWNPLRGFQGDDNGNEAIEASRIEAQES